MNTLITTYNPYRILGILAGTSKREQDRAVKRLKQYIEADQIPDNDYSFPILGGITRTIQVIDDALSHIILDKDKLTAALFWFYNGNPITDEPAFDSLKERDIKGAEDIWTKLVSTGEVTAKNHSAYHNLSILYLFKAAVQPESEVLIKDAVNLELNFLESDYTKNFKTKVTDETYRTNKKDIQLEYLSAISKLIANNKSFSLDKFVDLLHIKTFQAKETFFQSISEKLVADIERTLKLARSKRQAEKSEALKISTSLYKKALPVLEQLSKLYGKDSFQYASICDDIATELLQSGIDYFNEYKDSDKDPSTSVKTLLNKAKAIAVGRIAKQRIDENYNELTAWIKDKPVRAKQKLIENDLKFITENLEKLKTATPNIAAAKTLVTVCKERVSSIKNVLGITDELYLGVSSAIVNIVQGILVTVINDEQELLNYATHPTANRDKINEIASRRGTYSFFLHIDKITAYMNLREAVEEAYRVSTMLGEYDMVYELKVQYDQNHSTLKSIATQLGINTFVASSSPRSVTRSRNIPENNRPIQNYQPASSNSSSSSNWADDNMGCIVWGVIGFIIFLIAALS